MVNPKFKMFRGGGDQFYFRVQAGNGKAILASEGYIAKGGCETGIEIGQRERSSR